MTPISLDFNVGVNKETTSSSSATANLNVSLIEREAAEGSEVNLSDIRRPSPLIGASNGNTPPGGMTSPVGLRQTLKPKGSQGTLQTPLPLDKLLFSTSSLEDDGKSFLRISNMSVSSLVILITFFFFS